MSKDTEQAATLRYMKGGFGKLGSKKAYERYDTYIHEVLRGEERVNPRDYIGYIFVPKWRKKTKVNQSERGE